MISEMKVSLLLLSLILSLAGVAVEERGTGWCQAKAQGWSIAGVRWRQQQAASSANAPPIAIGQALEGWLEPGDPEDEEGRSLDRFRFDGQVGQVVTLEATSDEFDARLVVLEANGHVVGQDNDGGIGTNARVVLKVPQAGQYTILVSSSHTGEIGSYQLKLQAGEVAQAQGGLKGELDEQYYRQALEKAHQRGQVGWEARLLRGLGDALVAQAKYQSALDYYEQALKLAMQGQDRKEEAWVRGGLGRAYTDLAQPERAIAYSEQALAIAREIKDREGEGIWLGTLGNVYGRLGQFERAIGYHEPALAIAQEIKDRRSEGAWLGKLGNAYHRLGQSERAIGYYEQALSIAREINDRRNEGVWLGSLGNAYVRLGQTERAIGYYEPALAIAQEIQDRFAEGVWLGNLGNAYHDLGQYERAISYYEPALSLTRQVKNRQGEGHWLGNLGDVCRRLGQYERAISYYEPALVIARGVKNREGEAYLLYGLGEANRRLGQVERAHTTLQEALGIAQTMGLPLQWSIHHELARLAQQQNQPERAEAEFEAGRAFLENLRQQVRVEALRTSFFATTQEFYQDHLGFLVGRNQIQRAVEVAEAAHARSLLDLMAEAKIDVKQGIDPALKQRERATQARISSIQSQLIEAHSTASPNKSQIAALEEELKQVAGERERLEMEIRQKHSRYAELQYPTPLPFEAIQRLLDDQTVLLEYFLGQEDSFLFVVSQNDHLVARLPSAPVIADRVKKLRAAIALRPSQTTLSIYLAQAQSLYRDLVQPASKMLAGKRALLIVPDGILHYLPFEVLLQSGGARIRHTPRGRLPYLVRDYAISYAPSASVLASLQGSRQDTSRPQRMFLAYADPSYGEKELEETSPVGLVVRSAFGEGKPWKLPRLKQSREEVKRIAQLYAGSADLHLGKEATEESVKAEGALSQYRFIHFAAHGLLNENKPQFSGLILSLPQKEDSRPKTQDPRPTDATATNSNPPSAIRHPPSEDGLLQVYEIFNLKLNADMVVLSACETGLGKEVKGEGLIGLTRAFLYAGTPSVVVSLWKVGDRSTADLMVRFYRHLNDGKLSKAEALRQAQLELIRQGQFAHPYYWAPFVLVGEGK